MTKLLSRNVQIFLLAFRKGDRFYSHEVSGVLRIKGSNLGGAMSTLVQLGYIKPLYKESDRNVYWERIK